MKFGLIYFASGDEGGERKYDLVLNGARFADQHDFSSVWVPERHFSQAGRLFPNPAVLASALARETEQIGLRAGSVVLPLNDPIRVAEEWSIVDNLSGGRVGLSVASGWHPDDFVLAPAHYEQRRQILERSLADLKTLWRGDAIVRANGVGENIQVRTFPRPLQPELPLWLTAAGNPKTFRQAGLLGVHLLTHLFNLGLEGLAENIALYRAARAEAGHDPRAGQVAVMLHAFVAETPQAALDRVREPFCRYLLSAKELASAIARSKGLKIDLSQMSPDTAREFAQFVFDRLVTDRRVLFGSAAELTPFVERLAGLGVDEIAAQIDFGLPYADAMASLEPLNDLRQRCAAFEPRLRLAVSAAPYRNGHAQAAAPPAEDALSEPLAWDAAEATADMQAVPVPKECREFVAAAWRKPGATVAELTEQASPDCLAHVVLWTARHLAGRLDAELARIGRWRQSSQPPRWVAAQAVDASRCEFTLYDAQGQWAGVAEDVEIAEPAATQRVRYELDWTECVDAPGAAPGGGCTLLADAGGVAEQAAAQLAKLGWDPVLATDPRTLERGASAGVVLDFRPLDLPHDADPKAFHTAVAPLLLQMRDLAGRLRDHGGRQRLWIVTREAEACLPSDIPDPLQAAVWGWGRGCAAELNEVWGGLIDLPKRAAAADFRRLAETLATAGQEDQIAVREARALVPRLRPSDSAAPRRFHVDPQRPVLITGGAGGVGLAVARWLIDRGARKIWLWGRSPSLSPDRAEQIASLRASEAQVVYRAVDLASPASVRAGWSELLAAGGEPQGIVHAAGSWRDRPLQALSRDDVEAVLTAKAGGAWLLDQLAAETNVALHFFLGISSAAALLVPPGQANYAAANAALDAVLLARRARGEAGLTINWGPWAEVGFAATDHGRTSHAQLAQLGLSAFRPREALGILDAIAGMSGRQAAVAADWDRLASVHPAAAAPLFSELRSRPTAVASPEDRPAFREYSALPAADRGIWLSDYLAEKVAGVLHADVDRLDRRQPLGSVGLDSLMAVELKNRVESELGVGPPMVLFLQSPNVEQLAGKLQELLEEAPAEPRADSPPTMNESEDAPLAYGQQAIWFLQQLTPDSAAYNIMFPARLRSEIDPPRLRVALQGLVERHRALRTTYHLVGEAPVQRVSPTADFEYRVVDAVGWDEAQVEEAVREDAHRPFDLTSGPILRASLYQQGPREAVVLIVVHHVATDFGSLVLMLNELGQFYEAAGRDEEPDLAPLPMQYTDFVRWQQSLIEGAEGERLWQFWKQKLGGELPALQLPTDFPRPPIQTSRGDQFRFQIDPEATGRLRELAASEQATLFTTLLAAFQVLLHRWTGQEDVLVGSPATGRQRAELDQVVGCFINPLIFRADLSGRPTFREYLRRARENALEALAHQQYPTALLAQRLDSRRDPSRAPLFEAMFVMNRAQRETHHGLASFLLGAGEDRLNLGGLIVEPLALDQATAMFDLLLMLVETESGLSATWQYNRDLFRRETMAAMAGHFRHLLRELLDDPDRRLDELPLLSGEERAWRGQHEVAADPWLPRSLCPALFEEQVAERPDAMAMAEEERRWSYRQLDAEASQLARQLRRAADTESPRRIGVCLMHRSEVVLTILASWKTGAAYVPLDPHQTPARIRRIVEAARLDALVVDAETAESLDGLGVPLVWIDHRDGRAQPVDSLPMPATDRDVAYVIFTSGSTGEPKGVVVEHGNLASIYHAEQRDYGFVAGWRHLQMAQPAFDVFSADVVRILCSGGTMVVCPREALLEPPRLLELLQDIEYAEFVPAVLRPLMDFAEAQAEPGAPAVPPVRVIVCGADAWHMGEKARIERLCPTARVFNSYGLTETTIDNTLLESTALEFDDDQVIPIGRPYANSRLYTLDRRMAMAPTGVVGELYIGGPCVARGYLRDPALTATRFLPDPFAHRPGGRMVKTGDRVRVLPDGNHEFLGRSDHQVKVRGFRIELGEIEAALRSHPAVQDAAVLALDDEQRGATLAGYVTAAGGRKLVAAEVAEVRDQVAALLPEYMVPAVLTALPAMPRTAGGKIDRHRLPLPDLGSLAPTREYVPPRGETERVLVELWQEVMGLERVGVYDNFFELGGHSLLATRLVARVRDRFGVELPLRRLFLDPTVANVALAVDSAQRTVEGDDTIKPATNGSAGAAEILANLDKLSDDEVDALLAQLAEEEESHPVEALREVSGQDRG